MQASDCGILIKVTKTQHCCIPPPKKKRERKYTLVVFYESEEFSWDERWNPAFFWDKDGVDPVTLSVKWE